MADSPLTLLADVLNQQRTVPEVRVRIGVVSSVSKTGSVWYAEVRVDGSSSTRRMRWLGNGSQPKTNDLVTYVDQSPYPVMLGRVASDNEAQDFGGGAVSGGTISDSQGNLRTGINTVNSVATSAASTAAQGVSQAISASNQAVSASSSAGAAQSTASSALSQASAAQSTASNALNTANNAQNRISSLDAYARSIEVSLINLYGQVNFLNTRINNLEAYAVSLERAIQFYHP